MSQKTPVAFGKEHAQKYDERNSKLTRISDNLHFLMGLILKDLRQEARILCVGVGTGAEILSLAPLFPRWTFVGVEPSADMLEVCRERLEKAGVANRCELIQGYIHELPVQEKFDATLSILVAHFIPREERLKFFKSMVSHLKDEGYLINAEISFDLNSPEFPVMLKGWEKVQELMGATPESLAQLPKLLKENLTVLPPSETASLLKQSGISSPLQFFQALMICAWFGKKVH